MSIFTGIKNFLLFVDSNWTTILVCIGLIIGIYEKTKAYFANSKNEQIEITKTQIREIILKKISDAEKDYENWNKAGSIKRSQVIEQLYKEYPILSKIEDQESLVAHIDKMIDESLVELRKIIKEN